ncbi:MAG: hypothetical protein QOJ42_4939 [Acidobacteriaceae bacterium]|jgi:hypothetical protein|nr:hypothetical protein [Acidobacteriaceae bacterium]
MLFRSSRVDGANEEFPCAVGLLHAAYIEDSNIRTLLVNSLE